MDDERNIVLTGFMGTGKSTVGRLLAKLLDREWLDTDRMIESEHGPIPEIFAKQGEPYFRSLERQVARELAERTNLVISTGGGMVLDREVLEILDPVCRIFSLVAAPENILSRIGRHVASQRPLLAGDDTMSRIAELLAERSVGYASFEMIVTDGKTAFEVATDIARRLATT
ncbi:MAG: shikimate kinase [Acidimicrobiia bacterium]|nr:shikimate kinase [Acidimicrobiia bacterium]